MLPRRWSPSPGSSGDLGMSISSDMVSVYCFLSTLCAHAKLCLSLDGTGTRLTIFRFLSGNVLGGLELQ